MGLTAFLLLGALVTVGVAQDPLSDSVICHRPSLTGSDQQIASGLEVGSITVEQARGQTLVKPLPPIPCEEGPRQVIHSVLGYFFWPIIYKGSCDELECKDPPCLPLRKVWRTKCVLVFRYINSRWVNYGYRTVRYLDHLSCECRQCKHIRTKEECIKTYPCPNNDNICSYCFWKPAYYPRIGPTIAPTQVYPTALSRCDCCNPHQCCPAPLRFDYDKCRCECPTKIYCPHGQTFNEYTCKCT